ncbi:hypothetical protein HMPREF1544_11402 [Mucor circinelloides 1006PhL]|uniref:CAP-Gly domain-containing protein n=1 Tax=Mucor circinelloides f. circinelloides (strain 1006PhL) TaxID=1220926 RepID=S2JH85_MUCC1|nr:hypothetical protein HMPREF1544_11402 [Mucor circinelloides 1006PhL]
MHRLLLQQDDDVEEPMHRRALLSRATTTPMPRPSSLIKRFSDHTAMKRCSSLMNPPLKQSLSNTTDQDDGGSSSNGCMGGDLVYKKEHDFRLGQRVCVPSHNVVGTVKYFGEIKFKEKSGVWVGLELDLIGSGKNDGSIQGFRYFSCAPNTGLFVLATKVIALEDSLKKKIAPRISKTTAIATTKKSHSSSTTASKRKSMIITSSTTTSATTLTSTCKLTSTPKRNRSATTTTAPLNPSKSARTLSTRSSNAPLPTRSTPSGATKKMSTSTKTNKPALKKSSSMSTSSTDCHHHHRSPHQQQQQQQQQKRLGADVELERMQALLEKSRQEKRALSQQMDGQEAAWERLVSAKESYAVRVQEKDDEIVRLKRLLDSSSQATHELAKITSERDAAVSRASMSEAMEKQHSKVIERLDLRVRSLQKQLETQQQRHEAQQRDHAAQMDQIRKQLTERDEAAAIVERECSELRRDHVKMIEAFEATIEQRTREHTTAMTNKDAHIAKLQMMVNDLMYPSTASPVVEDDSTRHRLEAQLELTTSELDKERELIKSQTLEISHLKDEIKRLHRVSVCSSSDFYQLRAELEHEIEDKRRIMEEADAALEVQTRLEEENERIKLTNEKTQRDLADVLRKLATSEKERGSADLLAKYSQLEAENERLSLQQRQTEHECMRLMDELLAIEKVESGATQEVNDDRMYQREIEQLKLQVNREVKKYQDLEQSKEAKIHKLYKELSDLESLVENKVFNETELEEAIECEKRKVRMLEGRLREEEEKNRRLPIHAPLSPTSPQYSLFNRQHHQQKRSSTGSFSLMTSTSMDTVSDHGNLLESAYCEICDEYGHEVMTCSAYKQNTVMDDYGSRSSYYCVNCDVFDTHPTEDCPNQDETF